MGSKARPWRLALGLARRDISKEKVGGVARHREAPR
jgi:hypothetical protein